MVWSHIFTGCSQGGKVTFGNMLCTFRFSFRDHHHSLTFSQGCVLALVVRTVYVCQVVRCLCKVRGSSAVGWGYWYLYLAPCVCQCCVDFGRVCVHSGLTDTCWYQDRWGGLGVASSHFPTLIRCVLRSHRFPVHTLPPPPTRPRPLGNCLKGT